MEAGALLQIWYIYNVILHAIFGKMWIIGRPFACQFSCELLIEDVVFAFVV